MGRVNKEWRGRRRNSPHLLFTVSSHTTSGYHIHHSFDKQDRLIPLFYIKPQLKNRTTTQIVSCFIPLFYIKPQLGREARKIFTVVLYLCSTSNHNFVTSNASKREVVLYLCSTSNHNLNLARRLWM